MHAILPTEIVEKITLDAHQLRNLELCEELKRNVAVYQLANELLGHGSWKTSEFLRYAEEMFVGNAPDVCNYKTHNDWLNDYKKWKRQNLITYRKKWPKRRHDQD